MAIYRSTNPALSRVQAMNRPEDVAAERATYRGIAFKSAYFIILTFLAAAASFVGSLFMLNDPEQIGIVAILLIASLVIAVITGFIATLAPGATKIAGTIYALAEGFVVGFVSLIVSLATYDPDSGSGFGGIVFAALFGTIGVFAVMLFLYAKGIIRVGSGFKKFIISALIGMVLVNLIMLVLSLVNPMLAVVFYGNGPFSIIFSILMVCLAAAMILFDLNRITEIVEGGLGKKYEWTAAFGLLITLIWLYMEILKLLIKLSSRRR